METETLIQAAEKRKCLYGKADENYSNRNFTSAERKKVANEVGCTRIRVVSINISKWVYSRSRNYPRYYNPGEVICYKSQKCKQTPQKVISPAAGIAECL
ncbi:hypothetical protein PoB_001404300 [Plakobranchus ocellatus]|uniref:Homeobox domain-containing protein n=1 Tax=Plakobranchus ocellatus TaxID=259542 RepID=A0AAV3YYT4_9GAST|nr:hypothetical protein PoB_001404300 [Plakobranchus ocellatus]